MDTSFKYDPNIDYLAEYNLLPDEIYDVIINYDEDMGYKGSEQALKELEPLGWTFEYGLGNDWYSLRPIGEDEQEFEGGGEIQYDTNNVKGESKLHKNNTHFAIHKATNSIAYTWDYNDYDTTELNEFKDDYFWVDVMETHEGNVDKFKKSDFKILTRKALEKNGIDLNDYKVFQGQKYNDGGNVKTDFEQLENEDLRKALLGFYTDFHNNYISSYLDIPKESYVIDSKHNKFVLLRDIPISKVEQERLRRFISPYFNKDAKPLFAKHFDTYNVVDGQIIIDLNDVYEGGGLMELKDKIDRNNPFPDFTKNQRDTVMNAYLGNKFDDGGLVGKKYKEVLDRKVEFMHTPAKSRAELKRYYEALERLKANEYTGSPTGRVTADEQREKDKSFVNRIEKLKEFMEFDASLHLSPNGTIVAVEPYKYSKVSPKIALNTMQKIATKREDNKASEKVKKKTLKRIKEEKEREQRIKNPPILDEKQQDKQGKKIAQGDIRKHYLNMSADEKKLKYALPYDTDFDVEFSKGGEIRRSPIRKLAFEMFNKEYSQLSSKEQKQVEDKREDLMDKDLNAYKKKYYDKGGDLQELRLKDIVKGKLTEEDSERLLMKIDEVLQLGEDTGWSEKSFIEFNKLVQKAGGHSFKRVWGEYSMVGDLTKYPVLMQKAMMIPLTQEQAQMWVNKLTRQYKKILLNSRHWGNTFVSNGEKVEINWTETERGHAMCSSLSLYLGNMGDWRFGYTDRYSLELIFHEFCHLIDCDRLSKEQRTIADPRGFLKQNRVDVHRMQFTELLDSLLLKYKQYIEKNYDATIHKETIMNVNGRIKNYQEKKIVIQEEKKALEKEKFRKKLLADVWTNEYKVTLSSENVNSVVQLQHKAESDPTFNSVVLKVTRTPLVDIYDNPISDNGEIKISYEVGMAIMFLLYHSDSNYIPSDDLQHIANNPPNTLPLIDIFPVTKVIADSGRFVMEYIKDWLDWVSKGSVSNKDKKAIKLLSKKIYLFSQNPYFPIYLSTSYLRWWIDMLDKLGTKEFVVAFPNKEIQISTDGVHLKQKLMLMLSTRIVTDNGLVVPTTTSIGDADFKWIQKELNKIRDKERQKKDKKPKVDVTKPTPPTATKVARKKPKLVAKKKSK